MKFSTVMRLVSAAIALAAIALLAIGVSTLYWPKTSATVEASQIERVTLHAYSTKGFNRTDLHLQKARYTYLVNGIKHQNSQICFCVPLGARNLVPIGREATVSYSSAMPEWSVLLPGPDIFTVLILLLTALLLYLGEKSLLKLLGLDA
jgi:hypothetical protein